PPLPRGLYAIVDDASPHAPLTLVQAFLRGGARVIQLRFKALGSAALVECARAALRLCREHKALLFINDRADLVRLVNADGVHLGQDDLPVADARRILAPHQTIGLSTHSDAEIDRALTLGVDCIGFGPVFATATKTATAPGSAPLPPPHGIEGLSRAVARARNLPVIAIGGLGQANTAQVAGAGAHCVAAISELCRAEDPESAARSLVQEFARGANQRHDVLGAAARAGGPHGLA
ncbi:MAG: thiamine phosphate synthase, partial [Deltaproteobacteria bacterium]|nr:thiamine phosphate synthase [Deltaproteobacteria bacterium]